MQPTGPGLSISEQHTWVRQQDRFLLCLFSLQNFSLGLLLQKLVIKTHLKTPSNAAIKLK